MKQLGFFFDARRCNGCKTCVVACKDAHNLPVGRNFRHVLEVTDGKWSKDPKSGAWKQNVYAYYLSIACNHCSDPACVKACPTGAHHKRTEDGLVVINTDKCIGCGNCAKACPYGAPQLDTVAKKMTKCDACQDRLAKGLNPVCVDSCPQRAIEFGDMSELLKKHSDRKHIAPLPDPSVTKPNLLVKAPRNAKPVGDTSGTVFGADR